MDTALLLARLLLAGVFALSAVTKLADRPGSRKALEGFGVPARVAAPGAIVLPLLELAVAALVLPLTTAWWGALGALALLLAFMAGIAYNLSKGRTPDCHCFGKLHSEPIGRTTLARDAALAAVAGFVVIGGWTDPGHSAVAWLGDLTTGEAVGVILAAIAIVVLAAESWLLLHLMRQNGRLLTRLDALEERVKEQSASSFGMDSSAESELGLAEGTPAPSFRLDGIYGETMTLEALRSSGNPVLLVFTDPNCGPCNALMPELGRWQRMYASRMTIAVIGNGTTEANRAKAVEHGLSNVLLQPDGQVSAAYRVRGTPTAVLVGDDGTIGSSLAEGVEAIRALVTRVMMQPAAITEVPIRDPNISGSIGPVVDGASSNGAAPLAEAGSATVVTAEPVTKIGTPAPEIALPDLTGKTISLTDFRGHPTLVLFWNPSCGFCQRMANQLKTWEANPPAGAPKLLVVSTGTVEANEAFGFRSPVVLDQEFATGRAFGADGTPSAVLIDVDGRIASTVVVGAERVMALANGHDPSTLVPDEPAEPPQPFISPENMVKPGDPAPPVRLKDLDGKRFDLARHKGKTLALLFWDPECGFCQWLAEPLKQWEERPPEGAPQLIIVSEGSVEANREFGLRSRILLDDELATRRAYGAAGTPTAVLIDAEGRIASELVAGGRRVLDLLGYVPLACQECLEECRQRGGGDACKAVCEISGQCV